MSSLKRDLRRTQRQAFAPGTLQNLKCQWKKFSTFAALSGISNLPITTDELCLYIQFLTRTLSSPISVRNYVSGLKTLHTMLHIPYPSNDEISVRLTLRGMDRSLSHVPKRAHPITVNILSQIFKLIDMHDPFQVVVWTLFLFMFYLFSRKSQFIPVLRASQHVSKLVTRQDVEFKEGVLHVTLYWTKTRQSGGEPLIIPLVPVPCSPLCPVTAYFHMLHRVPARPKDPLFVVPTTSGSKPIVYSLFHQILRAYLSTIGLDSSQYSSHSFRRGGATFAFSIGLPGELIQSQGDWKSDAYKVYLEMDISDRVKVAKTMAHHVSRKC